MGSLLLRDLECSFWGVSVDMAFAVAFSREKTRNVLNGLAAASILSHPYCQWELSAVFARPIALGSFAALRMTSQK